MHAFHPSTTPESTSRAILRPDEAARFLKVAPQTLARWRVERAGPRYIKLGRLVGYRLFDLEAWIDGRAVSPTQ